MIQELHLTQFSPGLSAILKLELAAGNSILETSAGFPEPDSIFVLLAKQFILKHPESANLKYILVSDPHWWYAEYRDTQLQHILASRFN